MDARPPPRLGAPSAFAQEQPTFNDAFLGKLAGQWKIARTIGGEKSTSTATARWVLNHQFLRIDMDDDKTPSEYEATVFIGWDAAPVATSKMNGVKMNGVTK